jgi:hypothetical protein
VVGGLGPFGFQLIHAYFTHIQIYDNSIMTLSFIRSLSKPERDVSCRTQDDIYLRGPILLANRHFNPLTDYIPLEITIKTWQLAKSCADDLVDGHRFENAIWRLWGQQQLNLKRVSNAEVDW